MTTTEGWQAEKDLLHEGREYLGQLCSTTRYRHLFPSEVSEAVSMLDRMVAETAANADAGGSASGQ